MSKVKYIIKIQNISFELISKNLINEREYIKIKSIKDHEAKIFYAYSSRILFGLWKIHYDQEDEFLESLESFEDIISNMLCFELQRYIFDNIGSIPVDINIKNELKRYKNTKLVRTIFNGNRLHAFPKHEDVMDEYIYNDLNSLVAVASLMGVENDIINSIENTEEEEVEIKDSDKIILLKCIKNKLLEEITNLKSVNKDNILFSYKKEYKCKEDDNHYMVLNITLKSKQINIIDKNLLIYYINYSLENLYSNKKYNDLKYIVGIFDKDYQIDEYSLYTSYYDNLYNKLAHFVYDDETFFDDELLNSIRINLDDNIIFVGNMSNLEFN